MIFKKIHRGDSKRGCYNTIKYILDPQGKDNRVLLVESNCNSPYIHGDCIKQFAKSFSQEVADHHRKWNVLRHTKTNKLYEHYTISFPKDDDLSPAEIISISREAMQKNSLFGIDRSYTIVVHGDCDKTIHAHLVADRRNKQGIAYNPIRDMKIWNRISSEIEKDRNLTKISRLPDGNVLKKKIPESIPQKAIKKELKQIISDSINKSNFRDFIIAIRGKGITPVISHAKNKRISGVSFAFHNYLFKGSALSYSWKKITEEIEYDEGEHFELLKQLKEKYQQQEALNQICGNEEASHPESQWPYTRKSLNKYTFIRSSRFIDYYCNYSNVKAFREYNNSVVVFDLSDSSIDAVIELTNKKYVTSNVIKLSGSEKFKQLVWRRYMTLQLEKPSAYYKEIRGYSPTRQDNIIVAQQCNKLPKTRGKPTIKTNLKHPSSITSNKKPL